MNTLNQTVQLLVLASLPLRDRPKIIIRGHRGVNYRHYHTPLPHGRVRRRRYKTLVPDNPWLDVTDLVRKMFKAGKLIHARKGDITFNRNVSNTYYIEPGKTLQQYYQ